ncbi:MAG TPA: hypothetical protein VG605_20940, partial [Puia sp.]|nr:hypothetical protein [Puia sp.]
FPGKESLYRTGKRRRVVVMPWLQAGAAAAVLAAVILLVLPREPKNGRAAKYVAASPTAVKATRAETAVPKNNVTVVTLPAPATLHPIKDALAVRQDKTSEHDKSRTPEAIPQLTSTTPAPLIAATVPTVDTNSGSSNLLADAPVHPDKASLPVTTAVAVNIPRDQSSFATQALLKEAQEDGSGDMADDLQPAGKTKLRGLFRRVTRVFGKTADRDDDGQRQVLISAFQVELK